jgi:hypothetical protein
LSTAGDRATIAGAGARGGRSQCRNAQDA